MFYGECHCKQTGDICERPSESFGPMPTLGKAQKISLLYFSLFLSLYLSVYPSICQLICPCICFFSCLSICLYVNLLIYLCVYLSDCPSIYLYVENNIFHLYIPHTLCFLCSCTPSIIDPFVLPVLGIL
jgi:hypothetical protein